MPSSAAMFVTLSVCDYKALEQLLTLSVVCCLKGGDFVSLKWISKMIK